MESLKCSHFLSWYFADPSRRPGMLSDVREQSSTIGVERQSLTSKFPIFCSPGHVQCVVAGRFMPKTCCTKEVKVKLNSKDTICGLPRQCSMFLELSNWISLFGQLPLDSIVSSSTQPGTKLRSLGTVINSLWDPYPFDLDVQSSL